MAAALPPRGRYRDRDADGQGVRLRPGDRPPHRGAPAGRPDRGRVHPGDHRGTAGMERPRCPVANPRQDPTTSLHPTTASCQSSTNGGTGPGATETSVRIQQRGRLRRRPCETVASPFKTPTKSGKPIHETAAPRSKLRLAISLCQNPSGSGEKSVRAAEVLDQWPRHRGRCTPVARALREEDCFDPLPGSHEYGAAPLRSLSRIATLCPLPHWLSDPTKP